jgi:hypothetical protein
MLGFKAVPQPIRGAHAQSQPNLGMRNPNQTRVMNPNQAWAPMGNPPILGVMNPNPMWAPMGNLPSLGDESQSNLGPDG